MGYNPEPGPYCGMIYGGWVCAKCFVALEAIREELKARGSESQERTRRQRGQEEKDHDDAGKQNGDQGADPGGL